MSPHSHNFKAHLQLQQSQQQHHNHHHYHHHPATITAAITAATTSTPVIHHQQNYKELSEQEQQQHFRELIEMMDKNQDYDNKNQEKRLLKYTNNYNNNIESHTNGARVTKANKNNSNSNKINNNVNGKHILLPQSMPTSFLSQAENISKKSLFDVGVIKKQLDGSNERETIMNNSHR